MNIGLFDYVVSPHSGAGSADVWVLKAVREEHTVTVFASQLELPEDGGRTVEHVGVPSVRRPALASFLLYLAGASVSYAWLRLRGVRFDVVQATDCSFPAADICYAQFCHRAFLIEVWPQIRGRIGPRAVHSWASHRVRALIEARLVRRARVIVVPAEGVKRDFARVYVGLEKKITVIPNTVDVEYFGRPSDFDRRTIRELMGTDEQHTVFLFLALGHFERKGLPLLLHALQGDDPELRHARLWVVGGETGLVSAYRAIAGRLGVAGKVVFAGKADDVRPFLWGADAFVAPSHYEAFSLALLEAAAAGLPLIASRISGSEELLNDGINGLEVELSPASISAGLRRFVELDERHRQAMGRAARVSIEPLQPERFATAWRALYRSLAK